MKELHFDSIDSTNTYAKQHAKEFDHEFVCITADEQTAGRGQFQRKWVSPKGVNIYATFYFRLPRDVKDLTRLAQLLAGSIEKVLLSEGLCPVMKWPNDILLNGKKVCGVLCEVEFVETEVLVFLGMGVNVNMENFGEVDQPATSLKVETGREWDRRDLLKKIQNQFMQDLEVWRHK